MKDGTEAGKNKELNFIIRTIQAIKKTPAVTAGSVWCKRLSPVTLDSVQSIYFQLQDWKSIKILYKSKDFIRVCCQLSLRWISLDIYEPQPWSLSTPGVVMTQLWKWVFCMQITFSQIPTAVASCYLDDSSNKLSFPFFWCAVFCLLEPFSRAFAFENFHLS